VDKIICFMLMLLVW